MRPFLLTLIVLACFVQAVTLAETPEDVKRRLNLYRQVEAERAEQARKTRDWQMRRALEEAELKEARDKEEYLRTWKVYGSDEVNILAWKLDQKGTWVTDAKFGTISANSESRTSLSSASSNSAVILRSGSDRAWIRLKTMISNKSLANRLFVPGELLLS